MDIERVIKFEYCDFEVNVPANTAKNIRLGFYIPARKFDSNVADLLMRNNYVTRYKQFLLHKSYVIDLKTDDFIFFPDNRRELIMNYWMTRINTRYVRNDDILSKFNRWMYLKDIYTGSHRLPELILTIPFKDKILKVGQLDEDLLIQAIQKVINEANKEKSSQDDCTTLQEVSMEIF